MSVKGISVMVDYGHNVAGLTAVSVLARSLCKGRLLGVICGPGDRTDDALKGLGNCAGQYFDIVYIKEDQDRRNRAVGEVAVLLQAGASETSSLETIHIHLDEHEAIAAALGEAQEGDMMVILYEDLDQTLEILKRLESVPKALDEEMVVAGVGR